MCGLYMKCRSRHLSRDSQKTVTVLVAVWALTGLLAVQVYSPASLRLDGLMSREPPEMVILESATTDAPSLPHWTVTSVPAVHVQLNDTFLPSVAMLGAVRLTPVTASAGRVGENVVKGRGRLPTAEVYHC